MRLTFAALALCAAIAGATPVWAQDAAAGRDDFEGRCQTCHTGEANAPAPSLAGVVGRKAASTSFDYSPALKASSLTWTPATLDTFLAAPMKTVPGTRMLVSTPGAQQRANLIAYLATLK
jgi:cytochrome c